MSINKNNIPYSASDIEKYRKGELSAGEMHDLEQASLDDPFLADALDGLMQYPISQQDLSDLQERLNKKVTDNTRRGAILLLRRRITFAAAIILLLGMGFTFFYYLSDQRQRISQPANVASGKTSQPADLATGKTSRQPDVASAKAPEPAASTSESKTSTDKADSTAIAFELPQNSRSAQPRSKSKARRKSSPVTGETYSFSSAAPPVGQYKKSAPIADTAKMTANLAPSTGLYYNFRPTEPLVFSGKVFDINNRPLAGAHLTYQGNRPSAAITDNEGFFKLSVPQADSPLRLTVSLVGYNQTTLTLNDLTAVARTSNVIFLKPTNASLDEVVVSGYGAKRMATRATAPTLSDERLDTNWISAAPVIGREAYLQYLRLTKRKLGLDSTVTGTEAVSFIVSREGALSSFKIEQSLSPAHDAAIIRLITDGPAWRLVRGKKVRAAVTVNF